jgi:hypothetical protein
LPPQPEGRRWSWSNGMWRANAPPPRRERQGFRRGVLR